MRGKLMTIEGVEGAGKSTALQGIQDFLLLHHIPFVMTREPGGTALAEVIRQWLLRPELDEFIYPETELLLMFAARAQHIRLCIEPALQSGQWVVSDRYIDASFAYQGGGRNVNPDLLQALDHHVTGTLYPDLTLLLDVPVKVGAARAAKRGAPKDRIEQEEQDFFEAVRKAYLDRAEQDKARIKVIDASSDERVVQAQIHEVLEHFLQVSSEGAS